MKRFFTILMGMLGMVTTSCAQADSIRSVKAGEFEKEIKDRHVQLVDVRTADEYAGGFIAGALNIDVFDGQFMQKATRRLTRQNRFMCIAVAANGRCRPPESWPVQATGW